MAFVYLLLIAAVLFALQKAYRWACFFLFADFILTTWIFVRHIFPAQLG